MANARKNLCSWFLNSGCNRQGEFMPKEQVCQEEIVPKKCKISEVLRLKLRVKWIELVD
jgi:hypothetical protein